MKKLFIASGNAHKLEEIRDILRRNGIENIEIICPKDIDCKQEPVEDGTTFEENAYIKARFYHDIVNIPTIADDSGICIDYLDGKPGIHSARFLPEMNYAQKCDFIVDMMKDVTRRGAQFVDCLCFIDKNNEVNYYMGINEGEIAQSPAGEKGFGYDPIFLIPAYGKTEAELGEEYKNEYSHRAKALKKWIVDAKDKL
ncbi:MAG: RdgB/HAM1 family non-canonical purine NTP pyrophosphatase [Erysipelotrichaceae bacterium]|nr:RdgB/HAM1 family non-canonical purine NTP pyrophosphatase [Erysipelotrichaceae bacterium]